MTKAMNGHHALHQSASFSATIRVRLENHPGAFAALAGAIAGAEGLLAIDLVRVEADHKIRDVAVLAADASHLERILAAVRGTDGVELVHWSDRTFLLHLGGKLEVRPRAPLKTRDDLSMAYTPGVARVSRAIADNPAKVWALTIKQNTVAVVTDGTAVLGLGDIGPEGALPVMEGKAVLFKEFGDIDAWPVCLATKDVDEIVRTVAAIAPVFGGINLEDISAPRCFEVERRLRELLDIPVFHDDQHGTAIVTLAAFINALQVVGKRPGEVRVVMTGVGAGGTAVTKALLAAGVRDLVGCDRQGALYRGRPGLGPAKSEYASLTNPHNRRLGRRGPRRRRRLHRPLGSGRSQRRGGAANGGRGDRLRDGEPDAGGHAGGDRRRRGRSRDRQVRLPEPDQQRARFPRRLPRSARRTGTRDHAGDGACGCRGAGRCRRARRAVRRLHRAECLRPEGRADGREGCRRGGGALRCRAARAVEGQGRRSRRDPDVARLAA